MNNDREHAEVLRRRMTLLAWWREMHRIHPGGLVPLGTAARILGVQVRRVKQLITDDRLPVVEMPDGARADRFIPLDALLMAPSSADTGRPLVQRSGDKWATRRVPTKNIYGTMTPESAQWAPSEKNGDCSEKECKSLRARDLGL